MQGFVGKAEGKRLLGRPMARWEDTIEFLLRTLGERTWIRFMWLGIDTSGWLLGTQ